MYSFGKIPPRQLQCFGVSGLLAEKCYVFYDTFFSTKNIGRVSDLVAARLAKTGADELKIRTVLLFAVFESYRTRSKEVASSGMSFECGIDGEKIAFGVSFAVDAMPAMDGLGQRVASGDAAPGFEALLAELSTQADRVVVRVCQDTKEIEIIGLLGIPGRIDAQPGAESQQLVVIPLTREQADSEPPPAQAYVQLADLDYDTMLREKPPVPGVTAPSSGEVLSLGAAEQAKLEKIRVAAGEKEREEMVRIAGSSHVQGTDQTVIKVSGSGGPKADGIDSSVTKVDGGDPELIKVPGTEKYVERIKELEERIAELEAGGAGASGAGADKDAAGAKGIGEFLKNIWPFRRKKGSGEEQAEGDPALETSAEEGKVDEIGANAAPSAEKASNEPKKFETARARRQRTGADRASGAEDLVSELEGGGLNKTLARAQKEAAQIAKDARSKKWVDGLMKELVAEKAGLRDMAQKLNHSIKQKEHELKSQMMAMQEELRKKDEALKQKNAALNRSKEQLAHVSANIEKLKQSSGSGDENFKQKFNMTQNLLNASKDENAALKKKLDEMKLKLDSAAMKNRGANTAEIAAMKTKADRLQRQVDEFKRTNHELAEKLAEATNAKKNAAVSNADEMKKRLEAAVKMSTVAQKEADQLALRVEELQREEARLKKELERANTELKFLKGGGAKKPGGSAGGPPAGTPAGTPPNKAA